MNDRDSSTEKSGKKLDPHKTPESSNSNKYSDMDDKIKTFGNKVNQFIDQLQETGEKIFSTKDIQKENENLSSEIQELREKIEFLKKDRIELETKYQEIIDSLEEDISNLKNENEKIKTKLESKIEDVGSVKLEKSVTIKEMKEVTILNHFHPEYWDRLIDLKETNGLTLPVLSALLEMHEVHLIILALKLEVDHTQCLEVINELLDIGIIELKQKIEGGLNPLIKLREHI